MKMINTKNMNKKFFEITPGSKLRFLPIDNVWWRDSKPKHKETIEEKKIRICNERKNKLNRIFNV